MSASALTPAEHRALRELYALSRQLASHWSALAESLDGEASDVLRVGAAVARELLRELPERTAPHDLHGRVAAQGVGARLADARNGVGDAFLERAQALRFAVLDVQHLTTLLGYLERLAQTRGDAALATFHRGWREKLAVSEAEALEVAVAAGEDPDGAIAPLRPSAAGRAAHGLANAVGTAGEWVDRQAARARRR